MSVSFEFLDANPDAPCQFVGISIVDWFEMMLMGPDLDFPRTDYSNYRSQSYGYRENDSMSRPQKSPITA